jgi:5'-3' exoribonuclease 2
MLETASPLAKFFPYDFDVDLNGKKRLWESIPQIPFIDEEMLLQSASTVNHHELSTKERARNRVGSERCYVPTRH